MSSLKMTFSLTSLILIFALAAIPAMAAPTIEAEWDATAGANGQWSVTVTAAAAADDTAATVTVNSIAMTNPSATEASVTAAVDGTFPVDAVAGHSVAVRVTVTGSETDNGTYQRVTLPAAGNLAEMDLVLIPKLKKLTTDMYYVNFGSPTATVKFEFADVMADSDYGAATANLHLSDVTVNPTTSWQIVGVSGTDTVMIRAIHASGDTSVDTIVSLNDTYAMPTAATVVNTDTTQGDGEATVKYDNTGPIVSNPDALTATALPGSFSPPDEIWGGEFQILFSVVDDPDTSTPPGEGATASGSDIPMVTASPAGQVEIGTVGLATQTPATTDGTRYGVNITPLAARSATQGEVTLTITPVDKAGNEGIASMVKVKLTAGTGTAVATFTSATPASGDVGQGGTITLAFGTDPGTVTATPTGVTVSGTGTARTLTIPAEQAVGSLEITLTWQGTGTTMLTYTITEAQPTKEVTVQPHSYVIVARTTSPPGLNGVMLPSNESSVTGSMDPSIVDWAGMPNLEDLLYRGGSIGITIKEAAATALFDHDADNADPETGKLSDGTTDGTKPRQYAARDLVITEVMAALNEAEPGTGLETARQWIEIYNPNKSAITATLTTKRGRPALKADTGYVLLDRLSNVVGGGWKFEGLGMNGFDDGDPDTGDLPNRDFVSFYRTERGKDGHVKGHWKTSSEVYFKGHVGTPGDSERGSAPVIGAYTVPLKPAIINEVANYPDADQDYEWIEIKVTEGSQRFKNWEVEIITAVDTIKRVFTLPELAEAQAIGMDKVLLVTSTDPANDPRHPLAPGYNVEKNDANQADGVSPTHPVRYIVRKFDNNLPDDGNFVLTLRNRNDRDNHEGIVDIAGHHSDLKVDKENFFTNLWPLANHAAPQSDKNALAKGIVQRRQHAGIVGTGTTHGDKKDDQVAMRDDDNGWTGIGYRRNTASTAQNGGTPGYPHGAIQSEGAAATDVVLISEVMYNVTGRRAQWIELFNTSHTVGVNIDNWSLFVVNHNMNVDGTDYEDGKLSERIDLDGRIPPRQTFLIVSTSGSDGTNLPQDRIHNLRRGRGAKLLNPNGFRLTLYAKTNEADAAKHQLVDDAGNLPDKPENSRRADAQSFMDPVWMLPAGKTEGGDRVSLARRTSPEAIAFAGDDMGTIKEAWTPSDMDPRQDTLGGKTYYGHNSDISSPGLTIGGILPVSLSKFRPERLKDTGEIVVRWITESELNNAGFNILRSDKRDGEFTKVHFRAGQGTTSERTVYEWKDTSAKPNVVYYYQIQDVSLDGEVTTLRTTHLRGNVTAVGKATTTWGEIKALQ